MDKAVVEQSYGDYPAVKHLASTIEGDTDEMLLSFPPHFNDYGERENVLRFCHFKTPVSGSAVASSDLKACHDLGSL